MVTYYTYFLWPRYLLANLNYLCVPLVISFHQTITTKEDTDVGFQPRQNPFKGKPKNSSNLLQMRYKDPIHRPSHPPSTKLALPQVLFESAQTATNCNFDLLATTLLLYLQLRPCTSWRNPNLTFWDLPRERRLFLSSVRSRQIFLPSNYQFLHFVLLQLSSVTLTSSCNPKALEFHTCERDRALKTRNFSLLPSSSPSLSFLQLPSCRLNSFL